LSKPRDCLLAYALDLQKLKGFESPADQGSRIEAPFYNGLSQLLPLVGVLHQAEHFLDRVEFRSIRQVVDDLNFF
jgi:hypothetical protein